MSAIMYRVTAVVGAALILAACSSSNMDLSQYFKGGPQLDTVRFESQPPGAEAKTSTGQSCRTPCALALPGGKPFDVTFTLAGFQPDVEKVQKFDIGDGTTKLRPNPLDVVPLTDDAGTLKHRRRRRCGGLAPGDAASGMRKPATAKPAPAKPITPPPTAPQQQQAPSPWPAAPPPRQ